MIHIVQFYDVSILAYDHKGKNKSRNDKKTWMKNYRFGLFFVFLHIKPGFLVITRGVNDKI